MHATAVTGFVRLVLKRDGARMRSAKVEVNKFGTATKAFKNISTAGKFILVARYLGSPSLKPSADGAKLVV